MLEVIGLVSVWLGGAIIVFNVGFLMVLSGKDGREALPCAIGVGGVGVFSWSAFVLAVLA